MTKEERFELEKIRTENMLAFEKEYSMYAHICGIDEAGRGPLAGPVAAGAVILPREERIYGLNDSKKLSEKKREELFSQIQEHAAAWAVAMVGEDVIDRINILQATYEAMRQAVSRLGIQPDLLLNDAVTIPGIEIRQIPIIKGDAKSASIAAASICAKVSRDRLMYEYDARWPEYGFARHKGYGTRQHMDAIREYGPCPIHRMTFIKNIIGDAEGT